MTFPFRVFSFVLPLCISLQVLPMAQAQSDPPPAAQELFDSLIDPKDKPQQADKQKESPRMPVIDPFEDDPFADDPFGGASGDSDPFGGLPSDQMKDEPDPFGDNEPRTKKDPFGREIPEAEKEMTLKELIEQLPEDEKLVAEVEVPKHIKEKQEALEKATKKRKEQFDEFVELTSKPLTAKNRDRLLAQLEEWRNELDRAAHDELDLEYEMDARLEDRERAIDELREEMQKMKEELDDQYNRMGRLGDVTANHEGALVEIQEWFAHAVAAVDQPVLQKWVLSRLKTNPEISRALMKHHGPEDQRPPLPLKVALEDLIDKGTPELSDLAISALASADPQYRKNSLAPVVTSSWPIISEPGRKREQELIAKLDEPGAFFFFETPLIDVAQFIEDLYQVPVIVDQVELDYVAVTGDDPVTLEKEGISLRQALNEMLAPLSATFVIRSEAIVITTQEYVDERPVRRVYDLSQHRLMGEKQSVEAIVKSLQQSLGEEEMKLVPIGNRIIATGDEAQHYELGKMLTLLHVTP